MARTVSYTIDRVTFREIKLRLYGATVPETADNGVDLILDVLVSDGHGGSELETYRGWTGTTAAQRTALRAALVPLLKARVAEILETDINTMDLVIDGPSFSEQAKG